MNRIFLNLYILFFCVASLGAQDFNVLDYGAKADGVTLNTLSIQNAIDAAHLKGQSRVVIPEGRFLTGSITLKSGVELHLMEGSVLLGSTKFEDFKKVDKFYQRSIVMASYQDNISVTGSGMIDGQGLENALRTDSLFRVGVLDMKYYNKVEGRPRFYMRPMLIVFMGCTNVKVHDILLKNSASWVQHYDRCTNLEIKGVRVDSDAYWNNDGLDISDSKNVYVTDCHFDCADDGICLKSHYEDKILEDVIIENCSVRSSASAIKFGTKSLGGFKNVTIRNIKIRDTYRSAIAIESVDGGVLENVLIDSIEAVNTGNAIFIKLGQREREKDFSVLKNVTIKNVKVEVAFERPDYRYNLRGPALAFFHNIFPCSITGMPDHYVENVKLENIEIVYPGRGHKGLAYAPLSMLDSIPENESHYPEFYMFGELPAWGFYMRHVKNLQMQNIKMSIASKDYRVAFVLDDVHKAHLEDVTIEGDAKKNQVILHNSEDIKTDDALKPLRL